jgi:hypothetical protein
MAIFQPPDDEAYLAWLDANSNGYVINAEPGGRGYVLLHRATCTHMRSHPPFINATYIMVCSDSLSELDLWALQSPWGAAAPRCKARGTNCWQR